ncbi:MAG TPA: NAD-binding protein, partial [Kiloniellaceae bacterium]|nr:NAD-binding protein [Kiloniellaceae bacterium]
RDRGLKVLGVDFSPIAVRRWSEEGVDTLYRDIADAEFIASLSFHGVRWVVCAIPEHDLGLAQADPRVDLVQALRAGGYTQGIAVAATRDKSVTRLQKAGADLVDMPFRDAAVQAVGLLMGERPRSEIEIIEPEEQRELAL